MNVKWVNPFVTSVNNVMKEIGFIDIETGTMNAKSQEITGNGVVLMLGIVGDLQGNIMYVIDEESAKKIITKFMKGIPVPDLDSMAASSLSELSGMLSVHVATSYAQAGYNVELSPPSLMIGNNMRIMMNSNKVLSVIFKASDVTVEVNIAIN